MDYNEILSKRRFKLLILCGLLICCFFISFAIGRYAISPVDVIKIIFSNICESLGIDVAKNFDADAERIVLYVRLPRILASILVGAALSVSGATYQAIFRNPMVSPGILGATSSAGFGAAVALLFSFSYFGVSLTAFLMSLLSLCIVYVIALYFRGERTLGLILAGIMVSSLFNSATSFVKLVADTERTLPEITYWLMGSLQAVKIDELAIAAIPISIGIIVIMLYRWRINMFTMGEDEARSLGINTSAIRFITVFAATMMTAASVAISGIIGWVGLVIPHIVRFIVGDDYRYVLPASAVFGAAFLLIVDNVSRVAYTTEVPIGILTSFIGVPFFMYLMLLGGKKWKS